MTVMMKTMMMKTMMTRKNDMTIERLVEIADELGWGVDLQEQTNWKNKDEIEKFAEFSQYSNAGEDFSFIAYYDGTAESLVESVREQYEDFDVDEHASLWVEYRGTRGIPNSIRTLVEDAEDIEEMIGELANELEKELRKEN